MLFLFGLSASPASAQPVRINIEPPGSREFVRDTVGMLTPDDVKQVQEIAGKLLNERAAPIIVVTIDSMAKHGGEGMRIETFARLLFDQWQIGVAAINNQNWNMGILLLVSRDDRKARIELGNGWRHDKDDLAHRIMEEQIIPRFRNGDYPGGIISGVQSLDLMAREMKLPMAYRPWWHYGIAVLAAALLVGTIVSLVRNGSSGWAWVGWGLLFGALGYMLYSVLTSSGRSRGGGGGGFSGGSFGGGFSGGGGATGSW
ncbi:MAG: TPM domain-containing protein [Planctomycetes bacterium]|nr:TPM domain-containing protein [Planctomycetota bacterium]